MAESKSPDLPVWVYRVISSLLMTALIGITLWVGGRLLTGIESTALSVLGIEKQMVRLEARLDEMDRRLQRAEQRLDAYRIAGKDLP